MCFSKLTELYGKKDFTPYKSYFNNFFYVRIWIISPVIFFTHSSLENPMDLGR